MTKKEIKTGKEVLDSFFSAIKASTDASLDAATITTTFDLYKAGKLSTKNLTNALLEIRDKGNGNETK